MMRVLALADDMTGALEVGAKFAGAGILSVVTTDAGISHAEPVVVIDTETRHLSQLEAGSRIHAILQNVKHLKLELLFKKTDSTLRGNIASELDAMALCCGGRIVYAPAYPEMGRTVSGGRIYVDGSLLEETKFAHDPLDPVSDSLVPQGLNWDVEDDIETATERILAGDRPRLAAGTGALAGALASRIELIRRQPPKFPFIAKCLVVNGSCHEASSRQVAHVCDGSWPAFPWEAQIGLLPLEIAEANGRRVVDTLSSGNFDAVLICGGDTVFGFLQAAGHPPIKPLGEIVPGVAISVVIIDGRERCVITKAGGFGADDVLTQIKTKLNGQN